MKSCAQDSWELSTKYHMRKWINLFENTTEWTPEACLQYAKFWYDNSAHEDSRVKQPPEHYDWKFVPNFDINEVKGSKASWEEWMEDEIDTWDSEGEPDRYHDLLTDPEIHDPILGPYVDGKLYLWDGNHRVGASHMVNRPTVPAIVGILKNNK